MYKGGAGGYSFYVRKGEQVIRQRKNNSNYGEGASRSYNQMIRRIKWGNLVNNFKAYKSWQPKAYDSKLAGQTDYNIFMKLNIQRATASLTKAMSESGCGVVEGWQVSRGSLPPIAIQHVVSGNQFVTDIKISNTIAGGTTVGQLTADILANNPQFREGDNLGLALFYNWNNAGNGWPYVSSRYTEITLDSASEQVVFSIPLLDNRVSKSTGGFLQFSYAVTDASNVNHEVGFVAIHTRKSSNILEVSPQEICLNGQTLISQYSGQSWYDQCIATYGLSDEVPLDPSFPEGTISGVTANGAAVSNGDTLNGSQQVRVSGNGVTSNNVRLTFNGVEYTPLGSGDGYLDYIIGDNGTVRIYTAAGLYMSFRVDGVVVPEGLPTLMRMFQYPRGGDDFANGQNELQVTADCINYPYKKTESLPYFGWTVPLAFIGEWDEGDWSLVNCTMVATRTTSTAFFVKFQPVDDSKVAYAMYQDFIVAVFNY